MVAAPVTESSEAITVARGHGELPEIVTVEVGSHPQLIASNGLYARLYRTQFQIIEPAVEAEAASPAIGV